jgi:hypothetical protein
MINSPSRAKYKTCLLNQGSCGSVTPEAYLLLTSRSPTWQTYPFAQYDKMSVMTSPAPGLPALPRNTLRAGPILTMDRRPSAVLRRVFAGRLGPSGAKLLKGTEVAGYSNCA